MDVVYFELNNWACGRDYPDAEPFISWLEDDLNQQFRNEEWIKENKLIVVESMVDMSLNFCISAPKSWVEENCPELLIKYTEFLRKDMEGRFGCPFLEYKEEQVGYYYAYEEDNEWTIE